MEIQRPEDTEQMLEDDPAQKILSPELRKLISSYISRDIYEDEKSASRGQRAADKIAKFAGSWVFIGVFGLVILIWISLNLLILSDDAYDPYPFILLNLILSCIAALQAPVIMMSQNRQEQKDRQRAQHDYEVNVKAEVLIEQIFLQLSRIENTLIQHDKAIKEGRTPETAYMQDDILGDK